MLEKESDLYEPVKKYFEELGYKVNGEVRGCDLAAAGNDRLIICELKKSFTLKLVYQLMERKNLTPYVYGVIPRPKSFNDKNTELMLQLLKKIGAGLIVVSENTMLAQVVLEFDESCGTSTKKRQRIKNKIADEVSERVTDTVGGINQKPVMTLYKESSVAALCYLEENNLLKIRLVRKEIANAVKSNYYNWFEKTGRGEYIMSEKGKNALNEKEYKKVIDYYRNEVNEKCLK